MFRIIASVTLIAVVVALYVLFSAYDDDKQPNGAIVVPVQIEGASGNKNFNF